MEEGRGEVLPVRNQGTSGEEMTTSDTDSSALGDLTYSDTPADDQKNYSAVENALSIFPVLRNIFWFLDDQDLEICCKVSKNWRTVADIFMTKWYDIQLGGHDHSDENPDPLETGNVLVKKWDHFNRQNFTEFETNFEGAAKMLEDDLHPKIAVRLTIEDSVEIRNGGGKNFLSKFGHFVVALDFTGQATISLNTLRKLLLEDLPNLEVLNFCGEITVVNSPTDQSLNPNLPQNIQRRLTKISFSRLTYIISVGCMEKLLEMFPKLESIERMPFHLIEGVRRAQKGHAIKSLTNNRVYFWGDDLNGETVATAGEKLAELQPKLTSLNVPHVFSMDEPMEFGIMNSVLFSVLQSSSESLESLSLNLIDFLGHQMIPTMATLKSLELGYPHDNDYHLGLFNFFPRDVILQQVFPNVSDLCLEFGFTSAEYYVRRFLPTDIFSPWGSQIRELTLKHVYPNIPPLLQGIFPNIQELHLKESARCIKDLLPNLVHSWPDLKALTIDINWRPLVLDWNFLGLSEDIVNQVRDPTKENNFERFKDSCNICKLKGLKELRLVLHCCEVHVHSVSGEVLPQLTPITNEFGFKLLEELEVTVEIQRHHKYFKGIKQELDRVAGTGSGSIKIVESSDFDRPMYYRYSTQGPQPDWVPQH